MRHTVASLDHGPRGGRPEPLHPALHEPAGVRSPGHEVLDRIALERRESIHVAAGLSKGAEHGVRDPRPLGSRIIAGLGHALRNGRIVGNGPHPDELVGAQPQDLQEREREGANPTMQVEPEQVIDSPSEPEDSEQELVDPRTIHGGQVGSRRLPDQVEPASPIHLAEE